MSNSWTIEVREALAPKGRTLLITLGSPLRADDGLGPFVGGRLKLARPDMLLLDAGTAPENIAQTAIDWEPDKIILLDAADFGGRAGEVRVIPLEEINRRTTLSTHSFPLSLTLSVIKEDTGAELVLVGVQVKSLEHAERLSPEVEESALNLVRYFNTIEKL